MKWLVALLLLTACGHSTQPVFYTLSPHAGDAYPTALGTIEVRTPHIAGLLDRHQLVMRVADNRLELARNAEWAEPLDAMIARTLASDLAQRMPSAQVFTEGGEVRATPTVRVELDIRAFQVGAGNALVLDVLLGVRTPALPDAFRLEHVTLDRSVSGDSADALVTGMSRLLAELSERVIRLLAASGTPTSP